MRKLSKSLLFALILTGAMMFAASPASAAIITLTFEGIGDLNPVGNYYNGGAGPNYGVGFNADALAIVDSDAGGTGNIGHEPTPDTVLFFLTGSAAVMNVAAGFDTGFSFYYSAINSPGFVDVWDGLDGTGTHLAHLDLPVTPSDGGDPTGGFSPFFPVGVAFLGTAKSVAFGGVQDQIAFDNVTFGSETPTPGPEPASIALLGLGTVVLGLFSRRRH